jgi:hypothetical protein
MRLGYLTSILGGQMRVEENQEGKHRDIDKTHEPPVRAKSYGRAQECNAGRRSSQAGFMHERIALESWDGFFSSSDGNGEDNLSKGDVPAKLPLARAVGLTSYDPQVGGSSRHSDRAIGRACSASEPDVIHRVEHAGLKDELHSLVSP